MILRIGRIKRGFTLIEIMMAVAILSFGLVLVLQSFATALEGLKGARRVSAASSLLEEKMEELKEKAREENGMAEGPLSGEFDKEYKGYKWDASVKPGPAAELNELELTISWMDDRTSESLSAATYVDAKK